MNISEHDHTVLYYAYQHIYLRDEDRFSIEPPNKRIEQHIAKYQDPSRCYIGTVGRFTDVPIKRIESPTMLHVWYVYADDEMIEIEETFDAFGGELIHEEVREHIPNPLTKIPKCQLSAGDLVRTGSFPVPDSLDSDLELYYMMDSDTSQLLGDLSDVLLPLLGIEVVPKEDIRLLKWFCTGGDVTFQLLYGAELRPEDRGD